MLRAIGKKENIAAFIGKAKDKQDPFLLMCFGHRVHGSAQLRRITKASRTVLPLNSEGCFLTRKRRGSTILHTLDQLDLACTRILISIFIHHLFYLSFFF